MWVFFSPGSIFFFALDAARIADEGRRTMWSFAIHGGDLTLLCKTDTLERRGWRAHSN